MQAIAFFIPLLAATHFGSAIAHKSLTKKSNTKHEK
jgi:hypothetical protein